MDKVCEKINNLFNFESKKRKLLYCFCITFLLGILGYAFSFFHPSTTVDASLFDYSTDETHLYSIGRFVQNWYNNVVATYRVEFLGGIIWLTLISLCLYYTDSLFDLNNKFFILVLSACILFSGLSIRSINYFPFANPLFVLSLLLGIIAVYCFRKCARGRYVSFVLFTVLAIGLYQNAVCISFGLLCITTIIDLLSGKNSKLIFKEIILEILCIAISLAIYFIIYNLILLLFRINKDSGAYNSSERIQFYGIKRTVKLTIKTYILFFRNLVLCSNYQDDGVFKQFSSTHEIFVLIGFIISLYYTFIYLIRIFKIKKIDKVRIILVLGVLAVLPFAFACICVVTNGLGVPNLYLQDYLAISIPFVLVKVLNDSSNKEKYEKTDLFISLGIGAFISLIVIALYFIKYRGNQAIKTFIYQIILSVIIIFVILLKKKTSFIKSLKLCLLSLLSIGIIFNGISYANVQSTKNYVISQKRLSMSGRLIQIMEDENVDNSSKIYFYGKTDKFDEPIPDFLVLYLNFFFDKNYSYVSEDFVLTADRINDIDGLSCFPSRNCIKIIDGVLVVKLSE